MSLESASARKALADVTRRKGRTLLVVLGIFIGVFGLTSVNFTQDTIIAAYAFSVGNASTSPNIIVRVDHLDPALTPVLAAVPNVAAVQPQSVFAANWQISAAPGSVLMTILSYPDPRHIPITPFQLTSGRYPGVGEIVLEYGDQDLQAVSIGDSVTLDTGQSLTMLRVVGFVRTTGLASPAQSGEARGYMSDAGINAAFGAFATVPALETASATPAASPPASPAPTSTATPDRKVPELQREIAVRVRQTSQAGATMSALIQVLRDNGVRVLSANLVQPFNQGVLDAVAGIFALLRSLAMLAVALSGLLIFNTIATLITEQTAIIGTMKAIGGTRGAILRGYLATILLYATLGTLPGVALGLLLGYPLGSYLASTIPLDVGPFALAFWIVPLSLAVGFGVPLLAALLPLWQGTRITVRAALAAYGIGAGSGGGRLAGVAQRLTWVSQTTWMGLRGLFRRRGRAVLTLLALTLAGASFLVVQTASIATNQFIAGIYAGYHFDVDVQHLAGLSPQQVAHLSAQVGALPGVRRVEPARSLYAATTSWGQVQVLGFQTDTQLYRPDLISGHWLSADDPNGVLISDDLASKTGLEAGDALTFQSGSGYATLTVVGIVRQAYDGFGLLGTAITTIDNVDRIGGNPPGLINDLLVQSADHASGTADQLAREIDGLVSQMTGDNGGDTATVAQIIQRAQRNWYIFYALMYGVALIVGLVGILGLTNALTTSVLERRREIGLLRAMGASGWRVARVFWTEGLALGGIAWCAGALVGLPLAYGFIQLMGRLILRVQFVISPSALAVMLVAVLVIASLASIVPALRAARVRPAELLRYE